MDLLPAVKKALCEFRNQRARTELESGTESPAYKLWDNLVHEYEEIVRQADPSSPRQIVESLQDVMTFGKYTGQTIAGIIDANPGYILWLEEEKIVTFPGEIIDAAAESDMRQSPPEDFYWQPGGKD